MATESTPIAAASDAAPRGAPPKRRSWPNVVAIGLVVLTGCLCLAMPFWGDEALFTVYGRQIAHGAVLYRDVFDVKQPGIFLFYAIGGSVFGFTEVGIHAFELLYWLGFSAFALVGLRRYFLSDWGPPLVLVFTIVVYYSYAGLIDLTQVEILVAFPILLAWWLLDGASPRGRQGIRRYAAAGLAAAVVVLLKHLYVLIVLAFLVYSVARDRRLGFALREQRARIVAFFVSLITPLLVAVGYFAVYGQLGRIWWAYLELAPSAQLGGPRPVGYLIAGLRRFLIGNGPILIAGVLGYVCAFRKRARPSIDLAAAMVLWIGLGGVAFFVQGWPVYKWSLFTVPVGVLAAIGVDSLVDVLRNLDMRARTIAFGSVAALAGLTVAVAGSAHLQTLLLMSVAIGCGVAAGVAFLAPRPIVRRMIPVLLAALAVSLGLALVAPVEKVRLLARHDFGLTVESRAELRRSMNHSYRAADSDLGLLRRRGVRIGSLYVFGDPIVLLRADRPQAAPILGWGPEVLDGRGWRELYSELRTTLPSYIVIGRYAETLIRRRYPAILDFVASRYRVALDGESGTWYALR